jgi:heterodisulfide reductase subunit A
MSKDVIGSVMVVGGGIAGIQSALDLANAGFLVYMVEKSPAIGGVMSALDKTFPTNDCSMCILSPKLVEVGRHKNIKLLTLSEIESVAGEAGHFTVTVREQPRYIDMEKCIACGKCAEKCPRKVENSYNQGLNKRKAAYVLYPQAVPLKYAIDKDNCIYFEKDGKCRACEKFCPADAVDFRQQEKIHTLEVGSIIMSPGFKCFNPTIYGRYGYGTLPNVITSMEFERVLSASGPYEGHLVRPSDKKEPKKIAWLQCVGSRDIREDAHGYCSGVCCMYAIKEAIIAKEHAAQDLDTAIFFMDMRTHGKGFEQTYNRAKKESGVRFVRARVHTVEAVHGSDDLKVMYSTEAGELLTEIFDIVVLSVGLEISDEVKSLAGKLGVAVDADGFAAAGSFAPVVTSRPGVFVCGAFAGPKDIPQSVMEASAASSASAALLASSRNTLTREKSYPSELPVGGEEPRVGVFVCHCGTNIGGIVDVPSVKTYAESLPNVVFAADNLFTCSQDTQENIRKAIQENRLNRVVVAACTPRTHEPLFQETIREAGLNPYLFEFANIRDQNSWVHQHNPEAATRKAKDLIRMAVAKASLLEPIDSLQIEVNSNALVIGGGLAGMSAALNLADQGFKTYLVEREGRLGGHALHLGKTWKGEDVGAFLSDFSKRVESHQNIEVLRGAEVSNIDGFVGNFTTTVQAGSETREIQHGAVILATGGRPLETNEYLCGQSERVTKWHELEYLIENEPEKIAKAKSIVFIQCVGSREPERPYCSKICCTASIMTAIRLKEKKPDMRVYILYRDIRTFGQREELYRKAREMGVIFIRYTLEEKPKVEKHGDGLLITVKDHVLGRPLQIPADYLNLATAILPTEGQKQIAQMLKVPLNDEGFYLEAHIKLRPVDFSTDGVFVCGLAHYPKPVEESIAQAQAAATRAAGLLGRKTIDIEPIVSVVNEEKCIGCGLCEMSCAFGAIRLKKIIGKGFRAENYSALCKGCGVCAAGCPQRAIDMKHFREEQILAAIQAGGAAA